MLCARTAFTPMVLKNVVFPDMFEPVMSTPCSFISIEFGTALSRSGCRISFTERYALLETNSGST